METQKKLANTGDFFSRVEANVKNGWKYPANVFVYTVYSGGKWGNINSYKFFNGTYFIFTAAIPSWATRDGKYKYLFDEIGGKKCYLVQDFIKKQRN